MMADAASLMGLGLRLPLWLLLLSCGAGAALPGFLAGSITWQAARQRLAVQVTTAWGCSEDAILDSRTGPVGVWECEAGCHGDGVSLLDYSRATGDSPQLGLGLREEFTFDHRSQSPMRLKYHGAVTCDDTNVTFSLFADIVEMGMPSNSPLTAGLPVHSVCVGSDNLLTLAVGDVSGDEVTCHWSVPPAPELSATLDQEACTIGFSPASTAGQFHLLELQVRRGDTRRLPHHAPPSHALPSHASAVPLKFTAEVVLPEDCAASPELFPPLPLESEREDGAAGVLVTANFSTCTGLALAISPAGSADVLSVPSPRHLDSTDVTWVVTPSKHAMAPGAICMQVVDDCGRRSTQRCHEEWRTSRHRRQAVTPASPCLAPPPCQHGASCFASSATYVCACAAGYTGLNCETDMDECASAPCQNGGTCLDRVNGFRCVCPPGVTGPACSDVDHCASSPCLHGASCSSSAQGFLCLCQEGFTGPQCQANVDWCQSSPCQHGRCSNLGQGFRCLCHPGYQGITCSQAVDVCSPSPCVHGSACSRYGNDGFSCHCPPGYMGLTCEEPVGPQAACAEDEESFCVCNIGGRPSRVPLHHAPSADAIESRDVLAWSVGAVIGCLGTSGLLAAYFCCSETPACASGSQSMRRPVSRPSTSSTTISTLKSRGASDVGEGEVTGERQHRPINVYRMAFRDEMIFQTGARQNPDSYITGYRDW